MVAQQITGGEDQIVEVQQCRGALVLPEARQDRLDQRHEIGEHMGGDGPLKRCPSLAAEGVVSIGKGKQPVAVSLSQACLLGRRPPFPFLLKFPNITGLGAEIGMGRRDQQPDESVRRLGRQRGLDLFGQVVEVARDGGGLGLLGVFTG